MPRPSTSKAIHFFRAKAFHLKAIAARIAIVAMRSGEEEKASNSSLSSARREGTPMTPQRTCSEWCHRK